VATPSNGRCAWRDATYAIECGDTAFSAALKRLLLRAIAIGRRRNVLKDITLRHYLADLDRRLNRIMAAIPSGESGCKLRKRIAANGAHLFVFITNRDVHRRYGPAYTKRNHSFSAAVHSR
jgi:transposase